MRTTSLASRHSRCSPGDWIHRHHCSGSSLKNPAPHQVEHILPITIKASLIKLLPLDATVVVEIVDGQQGAAQKHPQLPHVILSSESYGSAGSVTEGQRPWGPPTADFYNAFKQQACGKNTTKAVQEDLSNPSDVRTSMSGDAAVARAMESASSFGVAEQALAQRPRMALVVISSHVYINADTTIAPLADHSPDPNVMVQASAAGHHTHSAPAAPAASVPLLTGDQMVSDLPAMQLTSITVREDVVVAPATAHEPAITLGYHSLEDYKFITSLPFILIEED